MWYPIALRMTSVPPVWADFLKTTVPISGSETASMMPRRYSALDVLHFPGSALDSGLKIRFASVHWLIVRPGGGFQIPCTVGNIRRKHINKNGRKDLTPCGSVLHCELVGLLLD